MKCVLHRRTLSVFLLAAILAVAGCGSGLEGTYSNPNGVMSLELDAGKAYLTTPSATVEATYEVKDDKVILHHEQGDVVLTRNDDGSLEGPMGTMTKRGS